MLLLALSTCLRQAELLIVTVAALYLRGATLRVGRQLLTRAGRDAPYLTAMLKTKASRRVLPLPASRSWRCRCTSIPTTQGATGCLSSTRPVMARLRQRQHREADAGTSRAATGFGMHALRHIYASSLIAQNLHPKVIQERLGNTSIVETVDTYSHLFRQAHPETAAALDRHYALLTPTAARLRAV